MVGPERKPQRTTMWERDRSESARVKIAKVGENQVPNTFHDVTEILARISHGICHAWIVTKHFKDQQSMLQRRWTFGCKPLLPPPRPEPTCSVNEVPFHQHRFHLS